MSTKIQELVKVSNHMFKRDYYLNELISRKGNHLVKVITGVRRSGKSFLLNNIFLDYLKKDNVDNEHIIQFAFDSEEDVLLLEKYYENEPTVVTINKEERINSKKFLSYVKDRVVDDGTYYFLLDEIQKLDRFVPVLNGLLRHNNYDIYVTGSNAKLLSKDIDTEFSNRGSRIHLLPLAFSEYLTGVDKSKEEALQDYFVYGGIPLVQSESNHIGKANMANSILKETYIKDILLRHPLVDSNKLLETLNAIASMISTPVNPTKIEKTFESIYGIKLTNDTIGNYITWFEDSYLINRVNRYDVKGRGYIGSPYKIYFEDIGIRNAALNYREIDETDLIENVVYNELRYRGFSIDVGIVYINEPSGRKDKEGKEIYIEKALEVDFVANKGGKTYYVQVALEISDTSKKDQEYKSIRSIPDSFKKIIIVKNDLIAHQITTEGFLRMSLLEFLTNPGSLEL